MYRILDDTCDVSLQAAADVVATEYGDLFDDDMDFEDKSHPKPSTEDNDDTDVNKLFDDDDSKSKFYLEPLFIYCFLH